MRVLVVDSDRCGLDFSLRALAAGHDVRMFRPSGTVSRDGQGFTGLTITSDLQGGIRWAGKDGLIKTVANDKYLVELDRWKALGYPVFGPTVASAQLEIDRALGMRVMEQHGMNMPKYHQFATLSACLAFAWKAEQPYVFKTLGSEQDKSLTFVASDPGQLVAWLEKKIKDGMRLKGPCMLQEKIADMIAEVGIAGYMGRDGFLQGKWEISFEHKKLCSGNFGPATGESGTAIACVESDPLADILQSFETHLRALGHTGDVAINGGVDKRGVYWPFEFTARAGWPDEFIRLSLHRGDPVLWMRDALQGKDTLKCSKDVAIGVVVAQKPYPFADGTPEQVEGKPIYGVDAISDDVHFVQVMMGRGPQWDGKRTVVKPIPLTTGPYVMVITGHGKTLSDANRKVYQNVCSIQLADAIVRDDIGEKIDLSALHALGIAKGIEP
jgi:phosphoribosylamine--glycine ligase